LEQNVETFVNNRRAEGAQLLNQIEEQQQHQQNGASGQADRERERLNALMERMTMDPSTSPSASKPAVSPSSYHHTGASGAGGYGMASPPPPNARYPATSVPMHNTSPGGYAAYGQSENGQYAVPTHQANTAVYQPPAHDAYNPGAYPRRGSYHTGGPTSPSAYPAGIPPPPPPSSYGYPNPQSGVLPQHYMAPGYVPPPPPPGPPPLGPQQTFPIGTGTYPAGPGGYATNPPPGHLPAQQQQPPHRPGGHQPPPGGETDPWGGLSAWR
jgi:hypothetical protein